MQWNYASASKKISGEQAALHAAISAYNTGSFTRGFNNGYVQKVLNNAPGVVTSGGKRNVAITPIAVINSAKAGEVKQKSAIANSAMLNSNDAVKLTASREDAETAFTVYKDDGYR